MEWSVTATCCCKLSPGVYQPLRLKGQYTLGNKLQQQVTATDHSVCTGLVTSCSNSLQRQSLHVYWRNFVKIFVSATEFCHRNKSHKFCLIWFFATCCCDKMLLQRQRFSQNSPVHTKWFVAVTSGRDMLLQLVTYCVPTLKVFKEKPLLCFPFKLFSGLLLDTVRNA